MSALIYISQRDNLNDGLGTSLALVFVIYKTAQTFEGNFFSPSNFLHFEIIAEGFCRAFIVPLSWRGPL